MAVVVHDGCTACEDGRGSRPTGAIPDAEKYRVNDERKDCLARTDTCPRGAIVRT